jgi:hypothetical protein
VQTFVAMLLGQAQYGIGLLGIGVYDLTEELEAGFMDIVGIGWSLGLYVACHPLIIMHWRSDGG